jgi:hypothetical protein
MRHSRPLRSSTIVIVSIALALSLPGAAAAEKDEPLRNCSLSEDAGRYEVRVDYDGDTEKDVQKDALLGLVFVGDEDFLYDVDWVGVFEGAAVFGVVARSGDSGRKLEMTPGPAASNDIAQDVLLRADALVDCVDLSQIAIFDEEMEGSFRKRNLKELKQMTWEAEFVAFGTPRSGGGCGNPSGNIDQVDGRAKIKLADLQLERALPDCAPGDEPSNDDFDAALDITDEIDAVEGTTICASRESGEPYHGGVKAKRSIWYRWTTAENVRAKVLTVENEFDTVVSVYVGDSVDALDRVASNDDAKDEENGESKAGFDAVPGVEYSIAVDGYGDACAAAREGEVSVLIKTTAQPDEDGGPSDPVDPLGTPPTI